jgi:hypothetical protein
MIQQNQYNYLKFQQFETKFKILFQFMINKKYMVENISNKHW